MATHTSHETHSAQSTTHLNDIRQWAESRDGKPAKVKQEGLREGEGILRINFPGYSGEDTLEEISWEEWYDIFRKRKLKFLYQDKTSDGKESRFFKLVANEDNKK
ncbi:MAG TPA: hypothetical protein VIM64_09810 [Puia sp.]|jgi:hypothetical protein